MSVMITTTSLSLLERMRGGSNQLAWRDFVHAYSPLLMAFAKRLGLPDTDADDAVQETLLAVHATFREMSEPFDRSKGRFKSWLRGVAKNKVLDVRRRRARQARREQREVLPGADADVAASPDANELFELEWQRNLLARALQQVAREVDPAVYQAFDLHAVHGHTPADVARLLGVTRNAVYISKHRILQRVTRLVTELDEQEG